MVVGFSGPCGCITADDKPLHRGVLCTVKTAVDLLSNLITALDQSRFSFFKY